MAIYRPILPSGALIILKNFVAALNVCPLKLNRHTMRKGTIIQIDQSVGLGFIRDENEQEIAFCLATLNENINIGDLVEFKIEKMIHGLTATNLHVLLLI